MMRKYDNHAFYNYTHILWVFIMLLPHKKQIYDISAVTYPLPIFYQHRYRIHTAQNISY